MLFISISRYKCQDVVIWLPASSLLKKDVLGDFEVSKEWGKSSFRGKKKNKEST